MDTQTKMRIAGESEKSLPRKLKFTASALASIKTPANGRITVYDEKCPGLAFTITSNNARAFYLVRRVHGRPTRLKLGSVAAMTVDMARMAATKHNGSIASGSNPSDERRQQRRTGTLGEIWEEYLNQYLELRATSKTIITDKSRWETCLTEWEHRKALDILPHDVRTLHAELGKTKGKVTANRAVQLLRRVYNHAKVGYNPVGRGEVDMFREVSRSRFLLPGELAKFLGALADISINPDIADIFRVSLFTGARRSNCQAARAEEFDLATAVWEIPSSKSKNGQPMRIPLTPPAMEVVKRRLGHASGFLFPSHSITGHIVEVKATLEKVLALAKLSDVHFHDLRRTFGSWLAAGGTSLQVIGKALGHRHLAATEIYSRLQLDAVRTHANAATSAMLQTANTPQLIAPTEGAQ